MSLSRIWWRQVGRSLRLCQAVEDRLYAETSLVLRLPKCLPWEEEFYEDMKDRLSALQAQRMVRFLSCNGRRPGDQILEELCSEDVRTGYWPGQSCEEYLAGLPDLTLNQMYVWVRQITTPGQLEHWRHFAVRYREAAARLTPDSPHALFVLEYRTDHPESAGEEIAYAPTAGDCQVFCLEAAALQEGLPTDYLATLAQCVGAGDPELSARLIREGRPFLEDPVGTARRVLGESGTAPGQDILHLRVWRAQIMVLFALVEEKRLGYIRANEDRLRAWLPTPAENGAQINDPYDLEFGNLFYMTRRGDTAFTRQETEQITLCRDVRNLLAHNELVPCDKALRLLAEG